MAAGDYKLAVDEDFDHFRVICETDDGWKEAYHTNVVYVWTKKSDNSNINIVKVRTHYTDIPASVLYDVLHDHEYRATWDPNMIEGKVIVQLDSTNEVGYYSAKSPSGVSNRDFLNQRSWRARPDSDEYLIINHAVTHPDVPDKKGFVRANSILTGYYIKGIDGKEGCQLIYCTQCDIGGWIPSFVANYVTKTFAPSLLDRLHEAAKKYTVWKTEHNPSHKPWLVV